MGRKKRRNRLKETSRFTSLPRWSRASFSLQEVLDRLAEAAVRIVGVKACSIRLLDEEAGDLVMRSTYG